MYGKYIGRGVNGLSIVGRLSTLRSVCYPVIRGLLHIQYYGSEIIFLLSHSGSGRTGEESLFRVGRCVPSGGVCSSPEPQQYLPHQFPL